MIHISSEESPSDTHAYGITDYGVISNHKYSDHLMEMMNRLEYILVLVPSFYSTLGRIRHGYITTGGKEKQ